MKITKQSLFNKFKSCNDKKSKISFLTKMKNLKSSTKKAIDAIDNISSPVAYLGVGP